MKKIKLYLTLISVLAITLQSCSLDEEVFGRLNEDDFPISAEDAESTVLFAYSVYPTLGYYSRNHFYTMHQATEEFTQKSDAFQAQIDLDNYLQDRTNDDTRSSFRHAYIVINRALFIIENVPNVTMNEELRNQFVGEGYFLRAHSYYNLVRLFGQVPLRKESLASLDDANLPLSSIEDIYQFIISDLRKAESLMDFQRRRGRANKVAAQSLLADAYLFLASAGQHTDKLPGYEFATPRVNDYYDSAAFFAGKVINDQSTYTFNNDLISIYNNEALNGPEQIFSVVASRTDIGALDIAGTLTTPFFDNLNAVLPEEQGGYVIGPGWQHVWVEIPFYDTYDDSDNRKRLLFGTEVQVISNDGDTTEYSIANGRMDRPFTLKYLDPGRTSGVDISGNNYPIIRYSEVLLTFAEAVGPTPEGFAAINQVRQRAGLDPLSGIVDVQEFREAVYQERTWELAYEFQHLFDLRRLGKMEEVLEGQYGKTIVRNAYYFEIPDTEINQNPTLGE
ncbi:RagB/SusD family nutrient uptake outer membrane protein [Fulvivirga sp. M361]|uniref:RagB/SusD family nutrient uptake outer membrane protein n=1 Tax=Fulvivirga sp. M361 TaxID=2594266 RepID=UPI00117B43E7|nr:RagB/SusD family nutrient uptake outer membrane protein [Fulvivirga sp. M361]TRX59955.1 RagB/SusD family nutrient uptake outer membrane protein [Fulvivirga sp. M361]